MKVYEVQFDEQAFSQLDDIAVFIAARDNPLSASRYIDRIITFCQGLRIFPRRATERTDLAPGLFVIGFKRRVSITFTIDEEKLLVWITGIYYGGQDWESNYA